MKFLNFALETLFYLKSREKETQKERERNREREREIGKNREAYTERETERRERRVLTAVHSPKLPTMARTIPGQN